MRLVSGGTDNHLMLVDVTTLGLGGKQAEAILDACGITVNKNMIPYDERKPMDPSGIRIGTPALTTRGMGKSEMKRIAAWMLCGFEVGGQCPAAHRNPGRGVRLVSAVPGARRAAGGSRRRDSSERWPSWASGDRATGHQSISWHVAVLYSPIAPTDHEGISPAKSRGVSAI